MDRRDFTRMHNEYLDYDRWAGDQEEAIDLTDLLKRMGKVGHGLCGKDADLDYGGQIVVESCYWFEDDMIKAVVTPYATICEPAQGDDESDTDYDIRRSEYSETVMNWSDYPGEWTGDEWVFHMKTQRSTHPFGTHGFEVVKYYEWEDDLTNDENEQAATEAIYRAIFSNQQIKDFQQSMMKLAQAAED